MGNPLNPNGPGLKLKDLVYYANFENETLTTEEQAEFDAAGRPDLGYYGRLSMKDLVNDFHSLYVGKGRTFVNAKLRDVEAAAQMGLRELSYDTSRTIAGIEVELNQANTIPMPQDSVKVRKVSYVNNNGDVFDLYPETRSRAVTPISQEEDFDYQYKEDGTIQEGEKTLATDRWQTQTGEEDFDSSVGYNASNGVDESFTDYDQRRNSGRFGINPETAQFHGTYIVDNRLGMIHFNSQFQPGDLMIIEYISDGIKNAGDLSKVTIDKFDEAALYACVKVTLSEVYAPQLLGTFKQDKSWEVRQAKIRNVDFSPINWTRLFRGQTKWIKH